MFNVKNVVQATSAVSSIFISRATTSTLNFLKLFNPMTFIPLQFSHLAVDSNWQHVNIWNCSTHKILNLQCLYSVFVLFITSLSL